jgi:hypothetical protein
LELHHVRRLRAVRRHHRARLLKRWTPIIKSMHSITGPPTEVDQEIIQRHTHLRLKTRKPCSCWLCSSWRRTIAGPTRQERLDQLDCQEQFNQLADPTPWEDPDPFYGPDFAQLAQEGLNSWLASLPQDDWGDAYERATPVHWDDETHEWVET